MFKTIFSPLPPQKLKNLENESEEINLRVMVEITTLDGVPIVIKDT